MRFTERLTRLKEWTTAELCKGRVMKAPAPGMNIGKIVTQEPKCFLAWAPARLDQSGQPRADPYSIVPSILIMPNTAYAKYMEEKRFDRYNNVHRPSNMGQHLAVSILFSVYEPGVRLPGFVDSVGENGQGLDMELMREGTRLALERLEDEARQLGADGVYGLQIATPQVTNGAAEIIACKSCCRNKPSPKPTCGSRKPP